MSVQGREGNKLMTFLLEQVRRVYRVSMKEHASTARRANYRDSVIQENEMRTMLLARILR